MTPKDRAAAAAAVPHHALEAPTETDTQMLEKRLAFFGLTPEVCGYLEKGQAIVHKVLPSQLDNFYSHVAAWPEAASYFKSETMRVHARRGQEKHWARIASGKFDQSYLHSSLTIGKTHNRIGLEPKWYIGGYAGLTAGMVTSLVDEVIRRGISTQAQKDNLKNLLDALVRGIFLDMDLAISTYLEAKDADFANYLADITGKFDAEMAGFIKELSHSATAMLECAQTLGSISSEGREQSSKMSEAASQSESSISTVSAAAEELSASTREISAQITRTAQITKEAVEQAKNAESNMAALKNAADSISTVLQLIANISEQTNLLALNATIEAARAGEAGKGFAVVANEVKALANQSRKASEEIFDLISKIQADVNRAVKVIQDVSGTIAKVEEVAVVVSSAVEEQSAATQEIVRSATSAAEGAKSLSKLAGDVAESGATTTNVSDQVNASAKDIGIKTKTLRERLDSFVDSLKGHG